MGVYTMSSTYMQSSHLVLALAAAAFLMLVPTATAKVGLEIDGAEIGDFQTPSLPMPEGPHMPDYMRCTGSSSSVCVIVSPHPCAGLTANVFLNIIPQGGVYVEVGVGFGPGGYGGYSDHCPP
jgi:hypothetical protein